MLRLDPGHLANGRSVTSPKFVRTLLSGGFSIGDRRQELRRMDLPLV
jgi:hypothetical protein